MVSFSCEVCNDTLVKKKLMGHFNRCPQAYFTCIDCNTTFQGNDFQKHTQCITENEKYQGKLYKPKEKSQTPVAQPAKPVAAPTEPERVAVQAETPKAAASKKASAKPTGAVTIKKTQSLDKVLKSLRKTHKLDKKELLKKLVLTPEGNLEWS